MIRSMVNGLVGACTLTIAHQVLRKLTPDAPRLDVLGEQGVVKLAQAAKIKMSEKQVQKLAFAGDIISNTLYFSQVGNKRGLLSLLRGASLGGAAGAGTVVLPGKLKLDSSATKMSPKTKALSISLYVLAGLAAGMAAQAGRKK
ncbi:MAG: hypothetical protein KGS72_27110 [Cyanobacteria bacterium REEB67]|nr:hypothetical protein [Cyanobacteria bacterium REEB67]